VGVADETVDVLVAVVDEMAGGLVAVADETVDVLVAVVDEMADALVVAVEGMVVEEEEAVGHRSHDFPLMQMHLELV
jgi:hypothetical protein